MIGRTQLTKIEDQIEEQTEESASLSLAQSSDDTIEGTTDLTPLELELAAAQPELTSEPTILLDDRSASSEVEGLSTPTAEAARIEFAVTNHITNRSGVNLHYVVGGEGEPVLLMHGFLGSWYSWRKLIPALSQKYTVIVPDLRGYGDSDKPADGYDAQTLVEDARHIVQELGFKRIFIAAHDMGAPPALLYAGRYPREVRALVYLDEPTITTENLRQMHQFTPHQMKKGGLWWWNFAMATGLPEQLLEGREREFFRWFYQNYCFEGAQIEKEAVDEYLRTFAAPGGVAGAFGVYRHIFETARQTEKFAEGVERIETPILAIGGEHSMGARTAEMLHSVASNVRGVVAPNCGHFIPEERPDYLVEQLFTFFKKTG